MYRGPIYHEDIGLGHFYPFLNQVYSRSSHDVIGLSKTIKESSLNVYGSDQTHYPSIKYYTPGIGSTNETLGAWLYALHAKVLCLLTLHYRPFQMRAWSCITSYPLRGLPYLAYDNVKPAMVKSMMLRSSMLAFEKVYYSDANGTFLKLETNGWKYKLMCNPVICDNDYVFSGVASSLSVRRGQSKRKFPIFAFSSRFFLFFPNFPLFSWFSPLFPDFWQFCPCSHWLRYCMFSVLRNYCF